MKTAVSIPDPLFEAAEQLAQRLSLSRSELYARALADYVEQHRRDRVTEILNEIYGTEGEHGVEPDILALQRASLPREDW